MSVVSDNDFKNVNHFIEVESGYLKEIENHIHKWQNEKVVYSYFSSYSYDSEKMNIPTSGKLIAITDDNFYLFEINKPNTVPFEYNKKIFKNIFEHTYLLSEKLGSYYNSEFSHFKKSDKNFNFKISQEHYKTIGGWSEFSKDWREEKKLQKQFPDSLKKDTMCPCEYSQIPKSSIEFFYSSEEKPYALGENQFATQGFGIKIFNFKSTNTSNFRYGPTDTQDYDFTFINPNEKLFNSFRPDLIDTIEQLKKFVINPNDLS